MNEALALMALARAQKAMLRLTQQRLRDEQLDGLARAAETKKHSELYFELRDRWVAEGLVSTGEAENADVTAGLN